MPALRPIPPQLRNRPFLTSEAEALGYSREWLSRGRRFLHLHRGVWIAGDVPLTLATRVAAARLVMPSDAVVSHITALRLLGIDSVPDSPLHFSTNSRLRGRRDGTVLHRRQGLLHPDLVAGVPVVGPDRAFVDSALILGFRDLVRVGDELVRRNLTSLAVLTTYAFDRHLDGVQRARRAVLFVREHVDSVRETDLRLLLKFARLPEPEVNGWIVDASGLAIARGDLVYRRHRVLVEYDGRHHVLTPKQVRKDHRRRERLAAAGWTLITLVVADFNDPMGIVRRVHQALVAHGYAGPTPVMSTTWQRWFNAA